MAFNRFQEAAQLAYAQGDYAHFTTAREVRECGDTLFMFVMVELGSAEGCETLEQARNRMKTAIRDIQTVLQKLNELDNE